MTWCSACAQSMDNRRTVLVLQLPLTCLRFGSSVYYDSVHIPGFNGMVYFHNQLVSSGRQAGRQAETRPTREWWCWWRGWGPLSINYIIIISWTNSAFGKLWGLNWMGCDWLGKLNWIAVLTLIRRRDRWIRTSWDGTGRPSMMPRGRCRKSW